MLFTGEEQGELGSHADVREHKDEMANHVAAVILDSGAGPVVRLSLGGHKNLIPAVQSFAQSAIAFGALSMDANPSFSTDCGPFILAGLPGINMGQDSPQFRYTHHSAADTFDTIKPDVLLCDATIMGLTGFWIADRPERLATPWRAEQTARLLVEKRQDLRLRAFGTWPFGDLGKDEPKK